MAEIKESDWNILANQELVSQLSPEFQERTNPERMNW
jgi:hypothetical protein